jgi:hypothetical protein
MCPLPLLCTLYFLHVRGSRHTISLKTCTMPARPKPSTKTKTNRIMLNYAVMFSHICIIVLFCVSIAPLVVYNVFFITSIPNHIHVIHASITTSRGLSPFSSLLVCSVGKNLPELIVLVDFKAIYPRVPRGIFAGFPGVAHFLSFQEICQ